MTTIHVSIMLNASPKQVWAQIQDIESHKEWMADALDVHITSAQSSGVGTTFEVPTKIGPVRLLDRMEITEWEPAKAMGVRHRGLVTGVGRFTLEPAGANRTQFSWSETLEFPWWLGAKPGGVVGARIMKSIWRKNLTALSHQIDTTL